MNSFTKIKSEGFGVSARDLKLNIYTRAFCFVKILFIDSLEAWQIVNTIFGITKAILVKVPEIRQIKKMELPFHQQRYPITIPDNSNDN